MRARREAQKEALRAEYAKGVPPPVNFSNADADRLADQRRRNERRKEMRARASEESRIRMLAKDITTSQGKGGLAAAAAAAAAGKPGVERITLHVAMPSGTTATLSDIPTDYKVEDIMMGLQLVEKKERKKERDAAVKLRGGAKAAERKRRAVAATPAPFALTLVYGGKHLVEGRAIEHYNIQSGSTL